MRCDAGPVWPSRRVAAATAAPSASMASPSAVAAGGIGGRRGVELGGEDGMVACSRKWGPWAVARRIPPRTVSAGRSKSAAIRRWLAPVAAARSAVPITSTVSARRGRHAAGSKTCVVRHPRHRTRRGWSQLTGAVSGPHGARLSPQPGQAIAWAGSCSPDLIRGPSASPTRTLVAADKSWLVLVSTLSLAASPTMTKIRPHR